MSGGGGGGGFDAPKREDIRKVPGRSSGVTASDIASREPGKMVPGKVDIVQTYNTGVAYPDHDAKCATSNDSSGCFMSPAQRSRFVVLLLDEIQTAQTNYKDALIELEVEKLIEKDDDLNWMASLVLDLATSHLSTIFSGAIKGLKGTKVQSPAELGLGLDVSMPADVSKWSEAANNALDKVSDKSIESTTKIGFDAAKKKTQKIGKSIQNDQTDEEKTAALSYIDRLKQQCDVGFKAFKDNLLATGSDAELVVVYRGMAPEYQSIGQYKAALAEKLARFKRSGVTDIGQKALRPLQAHVATLYENKRCVWLLDANGNKALWFYGVVSGNQSMPWENGRDPDIEKVADEFVDVAVAKSEQKWGATPTFEHPAVGFMRRVGLYETGKRAAQKSDMVASRESSFIPRLDLGKPKSASPVSIQQGKTQP
jgi:hypothetical protein